MRHTWLLLPLGLLACEQKKPAPETSNKRETRVEELAPDVVIGELLSLTGSEATYGFAARDGVELALQQANEEGGVHGRRIIAKVLDDKSKTESAAAAFGKLVEKYQPLAVIGAIRSNNTLAAAPLAAQHKVSLVTPGSTAPAVTASNEFVFRVCFDDRFQGKALAQFAAADMKAKTAAILREKDSAYSDGLTAAFTETWKAAGNTIVAEETYASHETTFKPALQRIAAKKPDFVFLPGYYTDVARVLREAKDFKLAFLGGDGWDSPRLIEDAGAAADGTRFSTHFAADGDTANGKKFVTDFTEAFGYEPDGFAAMGYEAARMVIAALRRAKTLDGDNVRKELAATKAFEGLSGEVTVAETRDAIKPAYLLRIEGGQRKFDKRITVTK